MGFVLRFGSESSPTGVQARRNPGNSRARAAVGSLRGSGRGAACGGNHEEACARRDAGRVAAGRGGRDVLAGRRPGSPASRTARIGHDCASSVQGLHPCGHPGCSDCPPLVESRLQSPLAARPDLAKQEAVRVAGSLPSGFVAAVESRAPGGVVGGVLGGLPAPGRLNAYREAELDRSSAPFHTEAYDRIQDNPFFAAAQNPLSTFSIDVDTASYANVRRFLDAGPAAAEGRGADRGAHQLLPLRLPGAERRARRSRSRPRSPRARGTPEHRLVLDRPAGRAIERREPCRRATSSFLIDVSGSMTPPDKLPLLKQAMALLVEGLREQDQVAIVVYAGSSGLVLPPTSGDRKAEIRGGARRARGGRLDRRAAPASSSPTASRPRFRAGRHQPRAPRDRRRLQRRRHQHRRADAADRGEAQERRLPVACSASAGQPQGRDDGDARRPRQRQLRVHRLARPKRARCSSSEAGATLVTIAKDVKIQVEFNPRAGRRLPADRLREPHAARRGLQRRHARTPARSAPATR